MNDQEQIRQRVLTRRAVLLAAGQLGLFGALGARLYYLQVVDAKRYQTMAEENRINLRLLAPRRGLIVDRFGTPLAVNQASYRVVLTAEEAGDVEATLAKIGTLVPLSDTDHRRVLRDIKRNHPFVPVLVHDNLAWDAVSRIEVNAPDLPGVSIETGLNRSYPFADHASHVVGYVAPPTEEEAEDDPLLELPDFKIGKSGIERAAEDDLRGEAGTLQVEVNALGRVVREIGRDEGSPGDDVVSTLDVVLQNQVQNRLAQEEAASCVVMDAVTGEVLVMASSPAYDSNAFTQGLSQELWTQLNNDPHGPLYNKTIQGIYPPGSTFKPCVALAALEEGIITPDFSVTCGGSMMFGNVVLHCWWKYGHGTLDLKGGLTHSCDIYFWEVARRVGIDKIAAMAHRLGIGLPTGIEIPNEHSGIMPTRAWRQKRFGGPWTDGETLNAGIGQGYVSVTPLQLATMLSRLVTNRVVVPHLIRDRGVIKPGSTVDGEGRNFDALGVADSHLAVILAGMSGVCNDPGGTAYANRIMDPSMAMGGKSGTAQVRHISAAERLTGVIKGEQLPWKDRDHGLFIAFAPIEAPRYVTSIVVEHGIGGSKYVAPIARDLLIACQKRDPGRRYPPPEAPPSAEAAAAIPQPPPPTDPAAVDNTE